MKRYDKRTRQDSSFMDVSKFRQGGFKQGPRETHKAVCADCKNECDVPFKPTEGRPVYCRDCFSKHKPKRF